MKTFRIFLFLSLMAAGLSVLAQPKSSSAPHVDLIVIDGSINPAVDDFIRESIGRAKSTGARALPLMSKDELADQIFDHLLTLRR